ncbi:phosphoribosylformylglycinamidine cyclo-ligase [Archaeoglobus veneficus]|uniref:Phosphoribosylformylglycinamidine cyclo-ligase n=1 Tax=Archaeoglobus veneficus (strain DSM 11195 / SNP6) TaxID=693661 RepID=F2KSW6_ARCVS|nr:phosphoribosylformylglycinamidine cyclo-ligase [Archaeoglobus veneficus]AEA47011.1 phosphoribosylformylglycinamidine cyclo-ligase [Archaeoglobus veneficus SNP6]
MTEKFSYAKSGVDIKQEEKAVKALVEKIKHIRKGFGQPILMGHYASIVDFGTFGIAITTDGVGSKIMVAEAVGRFDTIGIDCVAMNVNDIIAVGAEPVAMVDYIAAERPDEKIMAEIAKGLEKGCEIANITLVGGETATLPDMIKGFDLAGTAIGFVEKDRIITGEKVRPGDVIFGIPSSGIHSNGLTLARKVVEKSGLSYSDEFENGKSIGEVLLTPTRIYIEVLDILRNYEVHGMAHITGGGVLNLKRLKKAKYVISKPLPVQQIFKFIQELGNVDDDEMYRTFNMGMGFALIMPEDEARRLEKSGIVEGRIVGSVEEGEGVYVRDLRIDT